MATKKYQVKSPVRLEDGELVPIDAVRTLEEDDDDTQTFLARGVIVLVPGQEDESPGAQENGGTGPTPAQSANVPTGFGSGDGGDDEGGGAASPDASLVEAVGEDLAGTLAGGGITRPSNRPRARPTSSSMP